MSVRPVSFGKKIPIAKCRIIDNQKRKTVPATVYEYDCKNSEDIETVQKTQGIWSFKDLIENNMKRKMFLQLLPNKKVLDHFYFIETDKGDMVGMSQVSDEIDGTNIKYIETQRNGRYKYAGSALLSGIGLNAYKNGKKIKVAAPIEPALPFYIDKCGFKITPSDRLYLPADRIPELIENTEYKTNSKFIDLVG